MAGCRLAWASVAVIARYLTTIYPQARGELARWRRRALAIPNDDLRAHVLHPFDADGSIVGAALFAVLAPWRMQRRLVRLLVAYVVLWSYVDVRTERDPHVNDRLFGALVDALRVDAPARAVLDDAAYLATLIAACRRGCAALPSWNEVSVVAIPIARDACIVQAINHGPAGMVKAALVAWAAGRRGRAWQEQCAGASSPLAIHALMALAARRDVASRSGEATSIAYAPVSALAVLCDHLIDRREDHMLRNHSYLRHFDSAEVQAAAFHELARRSICGVARLPSGARHAVIVAAMVVMFVARGEAWTSRNRSASRALVDAVGLPLCLLRAGLTAVAPFRGAERRRKPP
jgi:tetraprenyl-beta-curcumene synthase